MTAVAGVLNKQGVALAADSAVTIGGANGHKIFNKANKVFTLSKEHPVGIMIHNSATFMETPWETIIKVYRKNIGNQSFPTLREYQEDFVRFLHQKDFFTNAGMESHSLKIFSLSAINFIINNVSAGHKILFENPTHDNRLRFLQLFEEKIDALIKTLSLRIDTCPEFATYSFETFDRSFHQIFKEINDYRFVKNGFTLSQGLIEKIKRFVFWILRVKEKFGNYTGLVFAGFGEDEIYPQLIPINILMCLDGKLRYFVNEDEAASISNENVSSVCPFAQTDVIETILTGIDPELDQTYLDNLEKFLKGYNQLILNSIGTTNPALSDLIKNIDLRKIVTELDNENQEVRKKTHIEPLMNAVSTLGKEDLAEMAESLIYLTYLKRRITFAEESVGGPIDVAIISKGDGFVWIKRKHYFKPELNQQFLDKYFKY